MQFCASTESRRWRTAAEFSISDQIGMGTKFVATPEERLDDVLELGPGAVKVWAFLVRQAGRWVGDWRWKHGLMSLYRQISTRLGCSESSSRRYLSELRDAGLVRKYQDGWGLYMSEQTDLFADLDLEDRKEKRKLFNGEQSPRDRNTRAIDSLSESPSSKGSSAESVSESRPEIRDVQNSRPSPDGTAVVTQPARAREEMREERDEPSAKPSELSEPPRLVRTAWGGMKAERPEFRLQAKREGASRVDGELLERVKSRLREQQGQTRGRFYLTEEARKLREALIARDFERQPLKPGPQIRELTEDERRRIVERGEAIRAEVERRGGPLPPGHPLLASPWAEEDEKPLAGWPDRWRSLVELMVRRWGGIQRRILADDTERRRKRGDPGIQDQIAELDRRATADHWRRALEVMEGLPSEPRNGWAYFRGVLAGVIRER